MKTLATLAALILALLAVYFGSGTLTGAASHYQNSSVARLAAALNR